MLHHSECSGKRLFVLRMDLRACPSLFPPSSFSLFFFPLFLSLPSMAPNNIFSYTLLAQWGFCGYYEISKFVTHSIGAFEQKQRRRRTMKTRWFASKHQTNTAYRRYTPQFANYRSKQTRGELKSLCA